MFDKYMIVKETIKNYSENGEVAGLEIGVRITYYRGVMLAVVDNFEVVIDGTTYTKEQMTFTVNGRTYAFSEMIGVSDVRWQFGDIAYLRIPIKNGLSAGRHSIQVTQGIRVSYGLMNRSWTNGATWKEEVYIGKHKSSPDDKIKRGVSLYSYQQDYYLGKMSLEDCLVEVSNLGADGVEIISEAMIENFPNPSEEWIATWHAWMKKYALKPTCYDAFMDGQVINGQLISDDEAVELMHRDLALASKMGFETMRVLVTVPFRILERAVPFAEKVGVKMGIEVHSPWRLDSDWMRECIESIKRCGSSYYGIIPDFGIFVKRPLQILMKKHIRQGGTPENIYYVAKCYEEGVSFETMQKGLETMNPNKIDTEWADEAYHYTYCDPKDLAQVIPYIIHIHGKFYEMEIVDGLEQEYSIPYDEIINVLNENGWSGYINSEYEGQRHYHDIRDYDVDSVEQVRMQHAMLSRLLSE